MKCWWESNINFLFGISFTLKPNKKLFPAPLSTPGLSRNLYVSHFIWTLGSTAGEEKRAGNCCQPLLGSNSLPFSSSLAVEPKVFSRNTGKYSRDSKLYLSWEYINCSQTHDCGNWDWGCTIPFLGIHKWNFPCSVGRGYDIGDRVTQPPRYYKTLPTSKWINGL